MKLLNRKQLYEIILILHVEGYYGIPMTSQEARKYLRELLKKYPTIVDGWIRDMSTNPRLLRVRARFFELYNEKSK